MELSWYSLMWATLGAVALFLALYLTGCLMIWHRWHQPKRRLYYGGPVLPMQLMGTEVKIENCTFVQTSRPSSPATETTEATPPWSDAG